MNSLFAEPIALLVWSMGLSAATAFAWFSFNNAMVYRSLRTRSALVTTCFTLSSSLTALCFVVALFPTGGEFKTYVFRCMWLFGGIAQASWVLAISDFLNIESPWPKRFARMLMVVPCCMAFDVLLYAGTGISFAYTNEPMFNTAALYTAMGGIGRQQFIPTYLGKAAYIVGVTTAVYLIVQSLRAKRQDRSIQLGVAFTLVVFIVEGLTINNAAFIPLSFTANLLEAARMTWSKHREMNEQFEALKESRREERALIDFQLKEMRNMTALAEIGEQTATITHDLRNPLTSALGALELMGHELQHLREAPPQLVELAQICRTSIDHVLILVQKVTRQARDDRQSSPENIPVSELVEAALVLCRHRLEGVQLSRKVPGDLAVLGQRTDLVQLLINLITNGVEAMESLPESSISIEVQRFNNRLHLRIQDAGKRPSDAIIGQMFRSRYTTRQDGTGLGLAICTQIAEDHGGKLYVDRSEEHTTMVVDLPALVIPSLEDDNASGGAGHRAPQPRRLTH